MPPFFFESSESDRVFNYLHDSNSIFRARGIKSEWVFRCTVPVVSDEQTMTDAIAKVDSDTARRAPVKRIATDEPSELEREQQ